ncbi:EF-hand domain-containing protein [Sphingomonas sp. GB1N7]|uniref:EF-hand domain-containing protein n=1 Tax=Parasphingomonas caseinilytica TaxID=3096158 RepID=UPI002FC643E3
MKMLVLAAALAGTILGGTAIAAQTTPSPAPAAPKPGRMMQADVNGDGTVTRAEFLAQAGARFDARDTNKDGTISGDELIGRNGQMRPNAQPITRTSAMERAAAMFDRLDTNKDGKLDPTERQAMMERMGKMRRGGGGEGAPGMAPTPAPAGTEGPHAMNGHRHGKMLAKLDTNKDGKISRDEMRAQADARFAKLDTNKDGFVDQTELAAARATRKMHAPGAMPPPPVGQ